MATKKQTRSDAGKTLSRAGAAKGGAARAAALSSGDRSAIARLAAGARWDPTRGLLYVQVDDHRYTPGAVNPRVLIMQMTIRGNRKRNWRGEVFLAFDAPRSVEFQGLGVSPQPEPWCDVSAMFRLASEFGRRGHWNGDWSTGAVYVEETNGKWEQVNPHGGAEDE